MRGNKRNGMEDETRNKEWKGIGEGVQWILRKGR